MGIIKSKNVWQVVESYHIKIKKDLSGPFRIQVLTAGNEFGIIKLQIKT